MERPRLLVVDGDHFTRLALNALFTRGGWQVSLAADLDVAIRLDPKNSEARSNRADARRERQANEKGSK